MGRNIAFAVYILPILLDIRSGHCPTICFWSRVSSRNSPFLLNLQHDPEVTHNQHNSLKLLLAYFLTLFERTTFGPWWWFLAIRNKMKEAKIFNFILKSGLIFYISFSVLKTQFLLSVTYQSLSLQRWANNSVFEYYSSIRIRILLETEYYSYSYSCDFLKPNIIRIRIRLIFWNRIVFVFVFAGFFLEYYTYFAEHWYLLMNQKMLKMPKSLPQSTRITADKMALVALIWLFSTVYYQK